MRLACVQNCATLTFIRLELKYKEIYCQPPANYVTLCVKNPSIPSPFDQGPALDLIITSELIRIKVKETILLIGIIHNLQTPDFFKKTFSSK